MSSSAGGYLDNTLEEMQSEINDLREELDMAMGTLDQVRDAIKEIEFRQLQRYPQKTLPPKQSPKR